MARKESRRGLNCVKESLVDVQNQLDLGSCGRLPSVDVHEGIEPEGRMLEDGR